MDHQHRELNLFSALKRRTSAPSPQPEDRWSLPDLIDFEHYLDLDEEDLHQHPGARKVLSDRDRTMYVDRIAPAVEGAALHTPRHRRLSLRRWLEARREGESPEARALLPGAAIAGAQRLIIAGLAVAGLLLGSGAASALLHYEGQRPVNVAWFVFLLVGVQVLIIAGGLLAWVVRSSRAMDSAVQDLTLLGRLIRPLFTRLGGWIQRHRGAHASQELKDRTLAGAGRLKAQYALYGHASYLPVLIPAQVFGVAFNLGVIFTTLSMEWFTDLAFGWGSTLDVDPQTIYELARGIAAPWRWLFGEGVGYPTLDQVAGSRINLKDPLSLLQAEHLRSWRWFLVLSVLTYGLLPRLTLLGASIYAQRHILGRLSFTHSRTQAVYARMVTPRIETASGISGHGPEMPIPAPLVPRPPLVKRKTTPSRPPAPKPPPREPPKPPASDLQPEAPTVRLEERRAERAPPPTATEPEPPLSPPPESEEQAEITLEATPEAGTAPAIAADACLLLIHVDVEEVIEEDDRTRLARMLMTHTGWRVAAAASFGAGSAMTEGAVRWVEEQEWQAPPPRMAIVMDGSQPPITENLRFLRELRAAAGTRAQILLALVGDPLDDDPLPPVRPFDFADWQRKIDAMGDPYLRLEMLAPAGEDGDG